MTTATKFVAAKTAVVLIEPQDDFLSPSGTKYAFIKDALARRRVIDNLEGLLVGARKKGVTVMYVPFHPFDRWLPQPKSREFLSAAPGETLTPSRLEQLRERHQIAYRGEGEVCLECGNAWPCDTAMALERIRQLRHRNARAGIDGLDGPEIVPQLGPKRGDVILEGKTTLDAFYETGLDDLLHANEIEWVAFTGFPTNLCVESSARSACDRGYGVIVVSDCTGSDSLDEQRYAETSIFRQLGQVMTAAEFLATVESVTAIPAAVVG
ncbi:MAG: cysteine hydrolase [Candidatus Dormiibacterota bacterium]